MLKVPVEVVESTVIGKEQVIILPKNVDVIPYMYIKLVLTSILLYRNEGYWGLAQLVRAMDC